MTIAALVAPFVGLVAYGATRPSFEWSVRRVVPLADGELLLVERRGLAESTMDSGRLTRITPDGQVLARVEVSRGGAFVLHGTSRDVAWLSTAALGVHARSLDTLEPVGAAMEAVTAHPLLGRGHEVVGLIGDGVILRARNAVELAVYARGVVEEIPSDAAARRPLLPSEGATFRDRARLTTPTNRTAAGTTVPLDALVEPGVVLEPGTESPLALDDPRAALVLSVDLRGPDGNHRLTRLSPDGVDWLVHAEDLVRDPRSVPGPVRIVGLALHRATLLVVAQAEHWSRTGDGKPTGSFDPRLAQLDVQTGRVHAVIPLPP